MNTLDLDRFNKDVETLFDKKEFNRLVNSVKEQNFVTDEDIFAIFPEAERDSELHDQIAARMQTHGIRYEENEPPITITGRAVDTHENLLAGIATDDLIGLYFREAGKTKLLTHEEEIDLAKKIESGRAARRQLVMNDMGHEKRKALDILIREGQEARDHLIKANSRLVISVAKKYSRSRVSFLDLIQEGNIGLMRAIKKFDYRRGFKFSTYATWWIRQAITRAVDDHSRTIRIPVHMQERIRRMNREKNKFIQMHDREPTADELSDILQIPTEKVKYMRKIARHPLSIHLKCGDDDNAEIGDFIKNEKSPSPEEFASDSDRKDMIETAFNLLPEREALVLKFRFGFNGDRPYTLEEIGVKIGVTRERVRQIANQGLTRLKNPSIRYKLQELI